MSSGVAWIDRKVGELRGAREHLTSLGLHPREAGFGGNQGRGWRLPHWSGVFTDEQLIEMARERGFRP